MAAFFRCLVLRLTGVQLEPADSGGRVEPALRANRDRLQRDRALRATDQHVGAEAANDRRFGSGATVSSSKDATTACSWSVYRPGNRSTLREPDIEPDAGDAARIGLMPALHGAEVAAHRHLRADDEAHTGRNIACEHAGTHLRAGRRGRNSDESNACKCHQCLFDHPESPAKTARAPELRTPGQIQICL